MSTTPDVVVLREGTVELSMGAYAAALRERLPDRTVELARTPKQERELIRDARVVTGTDVDPDLVDDASNLQFFACTFAGTDHLAVDELTARGVAVPNAPGVHAPGIA